MARTRSQVGNSTQRRLWSAGAICAAALCAVATSARADELAVPSSEYPTLRRALRAARRGDVIRLAPGEYVERRIRMRRRGVRLEGEGAVIRPKRANVRFVVKSPRGSIRGVTFASMPLWVRGEGARIEDCAFTGVFDRTPLEMRGAASAVVGCDFSGASRERDRGAVAIVRGDASEVQASTFVARFGQERRAAAVLTLFGDGTRVLDSDFSVGAGAYGGGLEAAGIDVEIRRCTFDVRGTSAVTLDGSGGRIADSRIDGASDEPLLVVGGSRQVVQGNEIEQSLTTDAPVVLVRADDARVLDTTVRTGGEVGLELRGQRGAVTGNSIEGTGAGLLAGIDARGEDARLFDNRVTGLGRIGSGIVVRESGCDLLRNVVVGPTTGGDGTFGINVVADETLLQDNRTEWTGTGVRILADACQVLDHRATRAGVAAFRIERGLGSSLTGCAADDSAIGYRIDAGAGRVVVQSCSASRATTFGLLANGVELTVRDSSFLQSGDVDVRVGAPVLAQSGNTFETGSFTPE